MSTFAEAINIYQTNYIQYRTTGRAGHKFAYEAAQRWIENYLRKMNAAIATDAQAISKFVDESTTANPELGDLQKRLTTIRKEGPAVQDAYATIKRVNEEQPLIDNTDLYVKAGIAAGLLGIVLVMSL